MKKKILFTGFGKFLDHDVNPSELLVQKFSESDEVEVALLPVAFSSLERHIEELAPHEYDVVLHFGLAASRKVITPEMVAINWQYCPGRPDNEGVTLEKGERLTNGPEAYFSTFDNEGFNEFLNQSGDDLSELSFTAGTYICNATFYYSMDLIRKNASQTKCCFIHLPPEVDLENLAQALESFLEIKLPE